MSKTLVYLKLKTDEYVSNEYLLNIRFNKAKQLLIRKHLTGLDACKIRIFLIPIILAVH